MKVVWFLIAFSLINTNIIAQSGEDLYKPSNIDRITEVLPPSPNSASLGNYGGISTGLVTGTPNINIDLLNIGTKNIKLGMTVNYTTSGFQVDQVASNIGMGWNLLLGGAIKRSVNDDPDEISSKPILPSNLYVWSQENYDFFSSVNQNQFDYTDLQPDIFYFNFFNFSGKFILNSDEIPVLLNHTNLKIEYKETANIEENFSFKITDGNGIVYYFGGNATEYSGTSSYGTNNTSNRDYSIAATAWKLRKIKHPNGDSVIFYYSKHQYYYLSGIRQTETKNLLGQKLEHAGPLNGGGGTGPCLAPDGNLTSTSIINTFNEVQLLDSVRLSNGQKLELSYVSRLDLNGGYLVNEISYRNEENPAVSHKFKFQYIYPESTSFGNAWNQNDNTLKYRAFLKEISQVDPLDATQVKRYKFSYNNLDQLPIRLSYCQDYWGYFNGINNLRLLYLSNPEFNDVNLLGANNLFEANANRTPNPTFAIKGLLSKITYPTGGFDSIIYEGNSYSGPEIIKTNIQNLTADVNGFGNNSWSWSNPEIFSQTFIPNQDQEVTLNAFTNFMGDPGDYESSFDQIRYSIYDNTFGDYLTDINPLSTHPIINDIQVKALDHSLEQRSNQVTLLANHSYTITVKIFGPDVYGRVTLNYQNYDKQTVIKNHLTGGVRVKKTKTHSVGMNTIQVKRYFYTYPNDTLSSLGASDAVIDFDNYRYGKVQKLCNTGDCQVAYQYTLSMSSSPNRNIRPFNGSNVAYPCVIESFGENFENGGIEHYLQTSKDAMGEIVMATQPVSSPFIGNDLNGREFLTRTFKLNSPGEKSTVKEIEFTYKTDTSILSDYLGYIVVGNYVNRGFSCEAFYISGRNLSMFDIESYIIPQRWSYAQNKKTTNYDQSNQNNSVIHEIEYFYENPVHGLVNKIVVNDNMDEKIMQRIKYPQDYSNFQSNQTLNNLNNLHANGLPIETIKIRKDENGNEFVIEGVITKYKDIGGKILIESIFQMVVNQPIPYSGFTESFIDPSGEFVMDNHYERKISFDLYDQLGNIVQLHKINGIKISYIWDYLNSYPIAEVQNATIGNIAYTSFEGDGNGNWNFSGNVSETGSAITGTKSYLLSTGTINKYGLITSTKYIVSYWSKGTVTIFGGVQDNSITGETINGWTYHEVTITGTTSITINGSTYIDELRLYPEDAQMTTYTYEPLIGMTSQCDINNKITYYEYNGLGRLTLIRDENNNILKRICYNYAGEVQDCSVSIKYVTAKFKNVHSTIADGYYHQYGDLHFEVYNSNAEPLTLDAPLTIYFDAVQMYVDIDQVTILASQSSPTWITISTGTSGSAYMENLLMKSYPVDANGNQTGYSFEIDAPITEDAAYAIIPQ